MRILTLDLRVLFFLPLLYSPRPIQVLQQEISWAGHLGITACILPTISDSSVFYAQAVLALLHKMHGLQMWIQVPIIPHEVDFAVRERSSATESVKVDVKVEAKSSTIPGLPSSSSTPTSAASSVSTKSSSRTIASSPEISDEDAVKSWERWNRFRLQCHHHSKLGIALELTEHLPSSVDQDRWFGEPLKAVLIPTRLFITNSKGAPVLSPSHVSFLHKVFKHNVQIIITGSPVHGNPASRSIYQQYIAHIFSKTPALPKAEQFCQSYYDYLQDPLQPLMDNLESATYEVFERDPIKYQQYEEAIYQAILDLSKKKKEYNSAKRAQLKQEEGQHSVGTQTTHISISTATTSTSTSSPAEPSAKSENVNSKQATTSASNSEDEDKLVVMIVGAGRGPIVEAAMRAEHRTKIPIKLYALDKNPNALVTMKTKQLTDARWKSVTLVHQDMRDWCAPEYADILVSEMLGSFGDNELSPECLQGAERLIEPNFGVSIPAWYTSFLAPISTSKLWNELSLQYEATKVYETSYVVKLHDFFEFSKPKPVFTFTHPSPTPFNNDRCITLQFEAPTSALMHGFSGYFDCCLYKEVHISIEPSTHTTDMVSWFPIWFPLRNPITVKKGDVITVHMWRYSGGGKVWYEWSVSTPVSVPIHNASGRSCAIGL